MDEGSRRSKQVRKQAGREQGAGSREQASERAAANHVTASSGDVCGSDMIIVVVVVDVVVIILIIITGVGIVRGGVWESVGGRGGGSYNIIFLSPSTALLSPRIAIFSSALAPILFPSCPR